MPPKAEGGDQDILVHGEDFRENWLEYHEDRLVGQQDEFFNQGCHYCGKVFQTVLKCFCHERFCKDGRTKRFTCRDCGVNFKNKQGLTQHGKRHKKPGGFFCSSCNAKFTSASARIEHRIVEHRIYQCQICLIKYNSSTDYTKHILTTHNEDEKSKIEIPKEIVEEISLGGPQVQLDPLIIKFSPQSDELFIPNVPNFLNKHEEVKENVESLKTYQDPVIKEEEMDTDYFDDVGQPPDSDSDLDTRPIEAQSNTLPAKIRIKMKDGNKLKKDKKYSCELCNKKYITIDGLQNHMWSHDPNLRDSETPKKTPVVFCKICKRNFENKASIKEHRKECIFRCAICNLTFCRKKNLLKHMLSIHDRSTKFLKYCKECGTRSKTKWDYEIHKKMICGKKVFECSECKMSFPTANQLKHHMKSHTKSKEIIEMFHTCKLCEKRFTSKLSLELHMLNSHNEKKSDTYSCHLCARIYFQELYYVRHMNEVHGMSISRPSGINRCTLCKRQFLTEENLSKHIKRIHTIDGKIQVKCTFCDDRFEDVATMKKHRTTAHRDKFICNVCGKNFKTSQGLHEHVKRHTEGKKKETKVRYLCGKCGKSFKNPTRHRDHERSDCGKSPLYQCDICKKFLTTAGILKSHKLIHSDIRPFPCKVCEKSFRTAEQLNRHKITHTDEKPFQCQYCPRAFNHTESLKTHLSVHTGFKRFMCTGCQQRFTCISNLQAHRRTHAKTCGLVPNCTKAVGPMESFSKNVSKENDED